jgi:hypothetical protein
MVFLAPLLLFGLLAALIPIAIHLIRRERPPKVVFGSIRFLKNTPKKLILFQQLQQWVLLLLRALLISLLVFAFARPLLNQSLAKLLDADPQSAVLVIDSTLSMRYRGVFAAAIAEANDFMDNLGPGDEVAIVVLGERATVLTDFTDEPAALRRALDSLTEPSFGASSIRSGLALADEMLAAATFENRSITLLSDFQATGADGLEGSWKLAPGVAFTPIDVGVEETQNLTVVDVRVPAALIDGIQADPVLARIRSSGSLPIERAQVSLLIDGEVIERAAVELTDVSEKVVEFAYILEGRGERAIEVRVQGDDFIEDNSRYAAVTIEPKVDVLVVNGEASSDWFDDEAHWFELASGSGVASPFSVTSTVPNRLMPELIQSVEVVVLLNVSDLGLQQSRVLADFVRAGAGLLVAPGDQTSAAGSTLDSILPGRLVGSQRLRIGDYRIIADFDRRHPLFAKLPVEWSSRFQRVWTLEAKEGAATLMRFDDASPALLDAKVGAGRVLLTAMPLDSEWGDFPLQPLYLPFVHELLNYLAARPSEPASYIIGDSEVADYTGVGLTRLERATRSQWVAINSDTGESVLARVSPESIFDAVINPENTTLAPREVRTAQRMVELESPQRLWWWILSLVLLLLLAETLISNRTYR